MMAGVQFHLFGLVFLPLVLSAIAFRWEESIIWPAVNGVEQYYDDDDSTQMVRTYAQETTILSGIDASDDASDIFHQAIERFHQSLQRSVPDDASSYPINPTQAQVLPLESMHFRTQSPNATLAEADEGYRLYLNEPDAAELQADAETVYGILHGLQTLLQLLQFGWIDPLSSTPVFVLTHIPQMIQDAPLYSYRGILVDTSRHFLPVASLLQPHIDLMAAHKLNVLHWHLTDDQSWPWQSKSFPELLQPHCASCVYTTETMVHEVVQYAAQRGVRVVVEVDTPGHTRAIGRSHPELLTLCEATSSGPLDATRPGVYNFLDQLYEEELLSIFPDPFLHLGGDEIQLACWEHSRTIRHWMRLHNMTEVVQVLEYFESYLIQLAIRNNRIPVVWQDVFDYGAVLPKSITFDVWKDWLRDGSLYNITAAGYDVILSAGWYLDHLGADWWKLYINNPRDILPNATDAQRQHVIGGHASMWGERVDATNFMEQVWPRASSVAEVLWSGSPTSNHTSPLDRQVIEGRLSSYRCWLLRHFPGVPISPIAPGSCGIGPLNVGWTTGE